MPGRGTEMLYYLLYHTLQKYFSPLNVFRYITVERYTPA